jgi:hypothetical protein|tara:strand:+ start:1841 stop:2194 length:354 start_codon:yes stop_codon:yes gene_type:complete
MTNNEINKIIATYHENIDFVDVEKFVVKGKTIHCILENDTYFTIKNYCVSLDYLIPVWKKLRKDRGGFRESFRLTIFKDSCVADHTREVGIENLCEGETIQQAAAHATCKAIQELMK